MSCFQWPQKTRDVHTNHFDSTVWDEVKFRDDDIVISTYAKAGTTWLQQIIAQLQWQGIADLEVAEMSPWVDFRMPPKEVKLPLMEEQTHRRFLKTHLPVDALVYSPKAKYLYIGRDGRDVVWSLYNHHFNANDQWYDALNNSPGLVGPPMPRAGDDIERYYQEWFDRDGYPFWPFWENIRSWWEIRQLPNLLMLHFADLKADMPGQIRRIAAFLDISIDETKWPAILEYCSFDYMKNNASKSTPRGGIFWDAGAGVFINKGVNGRWRERLSPAQVQAYERRSAAELGDECANWLASGSG